METIEKKQRGGHRKGAGRPFGSLSKVEKKERKYIKNVSCNLTIEEHSLILEYAKANNITVYKLVKTAVFDYIKHARYSQPDDKL